MLSINSHQLNVFLVAAETLNFTQAAQQLKMSQPSVSQHIQSLEEHFGLSLFARAGRNIELTDAGLALVPLAREVVYLAVHIEESMASLKGDVHGHLIVGCSTCTGRYMLPRLLATFHHDYPQVRATCLVRSQSEALRLLNEGKVHLALASNPPFAQNVEFRKVTSECIQLICPPRHEWASAPAGIQVSDLTYGQFILPEEGSETYQTIRETLAQRGISIYQLPTLVSLGSLEAIAMSVQEGLGVGFVPEVIVSRLAPHGVCTVKVQGMEILYDVYVGRNMRRPTTGAQEAFWEMITDPENTVFKNSSPLLRMGV